MIGVQRRGKDFVWLATYLLGREAEAGRERVEWTATRNLAWDDPERATMLMRATAAQNRWVEKPVYHIVLSAAPEDVLDRAKLESIADRVLERLGLNEHQALLVAHGDRPNHHLHIMVNRVHPETGRTWDSWRDWTRIYEVLREEERALGLRHVTTPPERDVHALAKELGTYARRAALAQEQIQAESDADTARTRATRLEATAERAQFTRERLDNELARVYRDPPEAHRAYAAAVDRDGLPAPTERMRERPEEFGALLTVERSRAFGLVQRADDGPARDAARAAATAARGAYEAAHEWQLASVAEAERAQQAFVRGLETLYQDPTAARAAFERLAAERGVQYAAAALGIEPALLGVVRPAPGREPNQSEAQVALVAVLGVESELAKARAKAASATLGEGPLDPGPELTRSELDRAMARDGALRAELRALPSRGELERRLGPALDRLRPRQLAFLKRLVTAPQFAIAQQLRRTFRDLALGREAERDE